jgi:hypothetical protein
MPINFGTMFVQVRFQAVRAAAAFVLLHEKELPIQRHLEGLLPGMVTVIGESVALADDETLLKSQFFYDHRKMCIFFFLYFYNFIFCKNNLCNKIFNCT